MADFSDLFNPILITSLLVAYLWSSMPVLIGMHMAPGAIFVKHVTKVDWVNQVLGDFAAKPGIEFTRPLWICGWDGDFFLVCSVWPHGIIYCFVGIPPAQFRASPDEA